MAGHSHWANIKHKKSKTDAKRGKVWGKCARAIMVAARHGGSDPATNLALQYAIDEARYENMPRDTIERAAKKGAGELGAAEYESLRYEGYGPGGVAIIVEALTDNRNRTASNVRAVFARNGGSLAETGAVAFMFERKGQVGYLPAAGDAERVLEAAIEAGAEDVESGEDGHTIWCAVGDLYEVSRALEQSLGEPESARLVWKPSTVTAVDLEPAERLMKLIEALEDDDDVQTVTANFEMTDEVMAAL